jgi:hypothetical protein
MGRPWRQRRADHADNRLPTPAKLDWLRFTFDRHKSSARDEQQVGGAFHESGSCSVASSSRSS